MKNRTCWLAAIAALLTLVVLASAAQAALRVDLRQDRDNPRTPAMGDPMRFSSTITNMGTDSVEGLVAWISLVEIDAGNEQPVDLEDWSASKAVTGAVLGPGQTLKTDWPMRLIKSGDYRVVVSLTDRGGRQVTTSPIVQFHVRPKPVLQAKRVVAVAAAVPLLICGWMVFNPFRRKSAGRKTPVAR